MNSHAPPPPKDHLTQPVGSEPTPHHPPPAQSGKQNAMDHLDASRQTTTLQDVCADINGRVRRFLSAPAQDETTKRTQEATRVAESVILQALQDFDFDALSLSYNGGKDCLVLLVLYLSVLHTHFTQPSGRRKETAAAAAAAGKAESETESHQTAFPSAIPSIYAKPPDPFDSVTAFVDSSTHDYHLDLTHISTNPGSNPKAKSHTSPPPPTAALASQLTQQTTPTTTTTALPNGDTGDTSSTATATTIKSTSPDPSDQIITFRDAFALYLHQNPSIQAIFVGTRRTDPHGATLTHFQMTDGNWPRFMRIHPVIDWRLSEIWCFLRSEHLADPTTGQRLDYCRMYDEGYTSLGGIGDTVRNPRLKYTDSLGREGYRPAYEMTEDDEERAGRE